MYKIVRLEMFYEKMLLEMPVAILYDDSANKASEGLIILLQSVFFDEIFHPGIKIFIPYHVGHHVDTEVERVPGRLGALQALVLAVLQTDRHRGHVVAELRGQRRILVTITFSRGVVACFINDHRFI